MIVPEGHTKVLIVGAGPSGLMMAAQLLRYGIQPVIIDCKQGPTAHSKALAVQARSLEIYRQLGIDERIVKDGKHATSISLTQNGERTARLALTDAGDVRTLFPYINLYPQNKNERLLLDHLTQNCCPVYWNTTLTNLEQKNGQADVLLNSNDQSVTIACNWVIGADGAHSAVRKLLQIPFTGDAYPHLFYLIDAELANAMPDEDVQLFLAGNDLAAFFSLPEQNCYRIIGNLPDQLTNKTDIQLNDVLPGLNKTTGLSIDIKDSRWFTTYRLHHRMAEKFRQGQCFLIGDAAHIHSPVGGQGMNTGLQDAYNLAWKLAGVINGKIDENILDSYSAERMPVARHLLKTTDWAFSLLMSRNVLARLFKKYMMPRMLKWAWQRESMRRVFFLTVSQIDISYRDSKINLTLARSKPIAAGDRLPFLKIFDEKKTLETDLHAWCNKPGFTLIVFGKQSEERLFMLARWLTNKYPNYVNFFYLPYSIKNHLVFDAFGLNSYQTMAIIVRPDMYIGYLNDVVDTGMMDNYLQNVVGLLLPQA